jgi:group I intron endonuclease
MGYIYKITNRKSGKIYIGKTVCHDPYERWNGHKQMFQRTRGGCPALRDAVRAYGIDAFMFEVLIICFDEDCDRWEKEYIRKFNCIVPNGYNILEGGQGGAGFRGKRHNAESLQKIALASRRQFEVKENVERARLNTRKYYDSIDRKEFGKKVTGSEKYQKALKEGRVGGRAHKDGNLSVETKEKIRQGVLKYFQEKGEANKCNIEKHREVMAKVKGRKVDQFDKDGKFIKTHISISEAARELNICGGSIQFVLKGKYKTGGGYIWKYHEEPVENELVYE